MLDALSLTLFCCVLGAGRIAVGHVDGAVTRLNNGGVGVGPRPLARLIPFQMPKARPGTPLILRNVNAKAVASALRIVADKQPAPTFQYDRLQPGAGIWKVDITGERPDLAPIRGFAHHYALGRRAVIPIEGHKRAVLPLDNA